MIDYEVDHYEVIVSGEVNRFFTEESALEFAKLQRDEPVSFKKILNGIYVSD